MRIPINPGGALDPAHVVGRDELIERLWSILETQSLAVMAPRRVGKTSICRRMCDDPPAGFLPRWRDLEGLDTAHAFVRQLYLDCEELLKGRKALKWRGRQVLQALAGTVEVGGFKVALALEGSGQLLDALLHDLNEVSRQEGKKLVLFWDEFTWFLSDLIQKDRADEAKMILDRLRAARQEHEHLRMVLTGSIGLHFVLRALQLKGYGNQPINDLSKQVVPHLDPVSALQLAEALLGNLPQPLDIHAARALAERSEGHPFLIHSLAQRMKFSGNSTIAGVDAALLEALEEDSDPLELSHFLTRLGQYFDEAHRSAAFALLDAIAPHPSGLSTDGVLAITELDRELYLAVVDALRRDQYVQREGTNLRFRHEFLRRYWCLERQLEAT